MKRIACWVVVLAACSGAQRAAPSRSFRPGVYAISFGATIDARRSDGSPWHVSAPDQTMAVVGAVVGTAVGQPDLGASVGDALSDKGGEPLPPRALVRIRIAGITVATETAEPSLSPQWDAITLDARSLSGDELALVTVLDTIDGQPIATGGMTVAELLGDGAVVLPLEGSVRAFQVRAELDVDGVDDGTKQQLNDGR